MKILLLDTSSKAASAALFSDTVLLGEYFVNNGKTHSQTILPMTEQLLSSCDTAISDLDALAVTVGPGSFTGLRIGMAAVKGMAFATDLPVIPISTLEGLAYNMLGRTGVICSAMDARCSQVYTAAFRSEHGRLVRLWEDCAIGIDELGERLCASAEPIVLVGDGAEICHAALTSKIAELSVAPEHLLHQHAGAMGALAYKIHTEGGALSGGDIVPAYLRLPQAQRELKRKREENGEKL